MQLMITYDGTQQTHTWNLYWILRERERQREILVRLISLINVVNHFQVQCRSDRLVQCPAHISYALFIQTLSLTHTHTLHLHVSQAIKAFTIRKKYKLMEICFVQQFTEFPYNILTKPNPDTEKKTPETKRILQQRKHVWIDHANALRVTLIVRYTV